jgi:hypothetical protein
MRGTRTATIDVFHKNMNATDKVITLGALDLGTGESTYVNGEAKIPETGFDSLPVTFYTGETSVDDAILLGLEYGDAHPDAVLYPHLYLVSREFKRQPGGTYKADTLFKGAIDLDKRHRTENPGIISLNVDGPEKNQIRLSIPSLTDSYLATSEPDRTLINTNLTPPDAPTVGPIYDPDDFVHTNITEWTVNIPPYRRGPMTTPRTDGYGGWFLENREIESLGIDASVWLVQDTFTYLPETTPNSE